MYGLSISLLENIAETLQIGDRKPASSVVIRRKDKKGGFEPFVFDLKQLGKVASIDVDRRWNMATDEINVTMWNDKGELSPDYSHLKKYKNVEGLIPSGFKDVMVAFNEIYVEAGYGNDLVRLCTGQIQDVVMNEQAPIIQVSGKNAFRKLLKPIDPITKRELVYENQQAFNIVKDLCNRAGIPTLIFDADEIAGKDFAIEKAVFELGTQYSEAIKTILDVMNHRITANRHGQITVLKKENYKQQDFHNWEFSDYVNMTSGEYKIDPSVFRNRVIVKSKTGWKAFEDPYLLEFCNMERISSGIEVPWAETDEQKWAVADSYFIEMRRKLRRLTYAVIGNPSMDVGDLVKMEALTSTSNSKYMITGIRTSISDAGYIDLVDLEFITHADGHICQPAEGAYETTTESVGEAKTVVMGKRQEIIDYAYKFLGTYYQWGGNCVDNKNNYGLDCSHFTYVVMRKFGLMKGYMVAKQQKTFCKSLTLAEAEPADLVFYTNKSGIVNHVGIYLGDNKVISASGGGSSTTTIGKARQQDAKVKIHKLNYRTGIIYFGRPPNM